MLWAEPRRCGNERMPIYEYACPKCRVIFNFLSKRINPDHLPVCPKCGNKKMTKQVSRFAMSRGLAEPAAGGEPEEGGPPAPDFDDPRVERAMMEMERDMEHMDENNPKHMAHMMRKMKDLMPPGTVPKELDVAIKRLEAGEDPEKIEQDMGDVLGDFMGGPEEGGGGGGGYTHDSGLYDY
jgi:putative FmdB family regulatory protein